jgi:hypothetical protein
VEPPRRSREAETTIGSLARPSPAPRHFPARSREDFFQTHKKVFLSHTSRTMSAAAAHSTAALALRAKVHARKVSSRSSKASTVVRASAVAAPAGVAKDTIDDAINSVRFLAIDAINKSNSGHPGLPMGCAPMGYVIFREAMTHNPQNTKWFNRDRFVLSAGHGCMLQYSLMHLTGYPSVSVRVRIPRSRASSRRGLGKIR